MRYLFATLHFAAVGAGPFFDDAVVTHVRRHYFQLALLAQLERAALLAGVPARAVAVAAPEGEALGRRLAAIGRDALQFARLSGVDGVSSQVQPGEMFALWRAALGLDRLAAAVRAELEAAARLVPPKEPSPPAVRDDQPAPKPDTAPTELMAELKRSVTVAIFAVAAAAAAGSALAVRVLTP